MEIINSAGPLKIRNGIPFREMELKSEMERDFLFGTSKCHVLHQVAMSSCIKELNSTG